LVLDCMRLERAHAGIDDNRPRRRTLDTASPRQFAFHSLANLSATSSYIEKRKVARRCTSLASSLLPSCLVSSVFRRELREDAISGNCIRKPISATAAKPSCSARTICPRVRKKAPEGALRGEGSVTSSFTVVPKGNRSSVNTNTPLGLISRVTPSPRQIPFCGLSQENFTAVFS